MQLKKVMLYFSATADKHKTPNLVPIGLVRPLDSKTILLVANFMNKTYKNLKNPRASVVIADVTKCPYQFFKGKVEIHESGKYFE